MGRDRLGKPAGYRDVLENASSFVPQEREPRRLLPAAPEQEHVEPAVVVEIGLGGVDGQGL